MFTKDLLFQNDKGALHHAYLVTGDIPGNILKLRGAIEEIVGCDLSGYPDYYLHFTPAFTVENSRELIERQKTRALSGGSRFFVIASYSFNHVAQNSLLKVLEDPIAGNHFFVLSATEEQLLPTLRSRLARVEGEELSYDDIDKWCRDFLGSDIPARLQIVEKLLKDEDKEGDEKLIKQKVKDIFNKIEKIIADRTKVSGTFNRVPDTFVPDAKFLSELIRMKGYLDDTAPALRLILEYIAFVAPLSDL